MSNATRLVLAEIEAERAHQHAKWGEQNHPDGTGRRVRWAAFLPSMRSAAAIAQAAKAMTDHQAAAQTLTYRDIALEEVAEAFAESDPATLRTELIQSAAVFVQWIEAIDRRSRDVPSATEGWDPWADAPVTTVDQFALTPSDSATTSPIPEEGPRQ